MPGEMRSTGPNPRPGAIVLQAGRMSLTSKGLLSQGAASKMAPLR
jgi:hypothetical protein